MAVIKKKCWPEIFEKVLLGQKRFDVRVADFEVKEGDVLILEEWDPATKEYTGRTIEKKAGYILKMKLDDFGQKEAIEQNGILVITLE